MTSHTPGPWRVVPLYKGGFQIRSAHRSDGNPVVRGSGGVRTEADARLIAAAPVLLDLCVEILPDLAPYSALEQRFRAAIAAATGTK